MSLEEILSLLTPANTFGGLGILVLCLSLVQVSPISINPWDAILGWLGNKTNASVKKTLDEQGKKLSTQNEEFREFWVDYQRESILRFSRECSQDISHSREEWNHVLNTIKRYEIFCEKNEIANGVIEENSSYLRDLHKQLLNEHRI